MKDVIEIIKETAVKAGKIALERRKDFSSVQVFTKATPIDLVTDVDRELERFITDELKKATPEYGFIGEEYGRINSDNEWCYCIDPIDGTTSYVHGATIFTVSIGVLHNGDFYAGAVYAPQLDELYWAEKGKGAYLNGTPIHVSSCKELSHALCSTGFACVRAREEQNNLKYFVRLVPLLQGIRRTGSAAFDLCQVAAGRFDGYWEFSLNLYDIAAGTLIAMEAGAAVGDVDGGMELIKNGIICSAPGIHEQLRRELH
jgi:myo-inositol-1(or 4)-monophosphatase